VQPDANFVQPGTDPDAAGPAAAGEELLPLASTSVSPELLGSPNGTATISWHTAGGDFSVSFSAGPSLTVVPPVTRPFPESFLSPGPVTNGEGGPSGPEVKVAFHAARPGAALQHGTVAVFTAEREFFSHLSDGSLLQRFAFGGEQAAFTTLVQRYERFVLDVCERVLGDAHTAQDALQATFLILARKASMLDTKDPLAGWLYKVAYHLALRLRSVTAKRHRREKGTPNGKSSRVANDHAAEIEKEELRQALRDELQRLPEKYRLPLVLCYFEGLTHEDAARAIGVARGSMARLIGTGLERLRERLLERGLLP
jgi:RNA polymerase sigma factor (sigma-70 family)